MKLFKYIKDTAVNSYKLSKLFLKENKRLLAMDVFLGLSREVIGLIVMSIPAIVIYLLEAKLSLNALFYSVSALIIAMIVLNISEETTRRYLSNYSLRATNSLYYILNRKASRLDMRDCEDEDVVDCYYKAFDNIYDFSDVHYHVFCTFLSKFFVFIVITVFLSSLNWLLYLVIFLSNIVLLFLRAKNDKIIHDLELEQSESTKRIKYLNELLRDFRAGREIRAYNSSSMIRDKFLKESQVLYNIEVRVKKISLAFFLLYKLIETSQLICTYCVAIFVYSRGEILIGDFVLYTNMIALVSSTISGITQTFSFLHRSSISYEDFEAYLSIRESLRGGAMSPPRLTSHAIPIIEFKNVSFKYPHQDEMALSNISFTINSGDHVSLAGDNGAGKTTIVKLLLRLYDPSSGDIYFNGVNIKDLDYDEYQFLFSSVFQDYIMYAYTIRENLIFNHEECSKHIAEALNGVGMYDKVYDIGLDKNYTKRFFDDGIEFSGGEEQRIAIARALCKNGEVLILDEPTSAIDPVSENRLFKEMFSFSVGKTAIFVSHRMSSARFANKIFVIDNGKLVESGSHDELMLAKGLYYDIFRKQSSYYTDGVI